MNSDTVLHLIQRAIEAGREGSPEIGDFHNELDVLLTTGKRDTVIRDFFDCWADAINHDYMVYKTKDPNEWLMAAQELKLWYQNNETQLSRRALWQETIKI